LFYVTEKLLKNTYRFSKPHICSKSFVGDITTKELALHYMGNPTVKNYRKYIETATKAMWASGTLYMTFEDIIDNHIRISEDEYIPIEEFSVSDGDLNAIKEVIERDIIDNTFKSLLYMKDFSCYPDIGYEWNSFLLASLIEHFDIGFKTIAYDIKNKRYNRKIIVNKESVLNNLSDVVCYILDMSAINEISENDLLSLLIVNELAIAVIPYELYESNDLEFNNFYVKRK